MTALTLECDLRFSTLVNELNCAVGVKDKASSDHLHAIKSFVTISSTESHRKCLFDVALLPPLFHWLQEDRDEVVLNSAHALVYLAKYTDNSADILIDKNNLLILLSVLKGASSRCTEIISSLFCKLSRLEERVLMFDVVHAKEIILMKLAQSSATTKTKEFLTKTLIHVAIARLNHSNAVITLSDSTILEFISSLLETGDTNHLGPLLYKLTCCSTTNALKFIEYKIPSQLAEIATKINKTKDIENILKVIENCSKFWREEIFCSISIITVSKLLIEQIYNPISELSIYRSLRAMKHLFKQSSHRQSIIDCGLFDEFQKITKAPQCHRKEVLDILLLFYNSNKLCPRLLRPWVWQSFLDYCDSTDVMNATHDRNERAIALRGLLHLSSICINTSEIPLSKMVPKLSELLLDCSDHEAGTIVGILKNFAIDSAGTRCLTEHNIISAIVRRIENGSERYLEKSISFVSFLIDSDRNTIPVVIESGIVRCICSLMGYYSCSVQRHVAFFLAKITTNESNLIIFAQDGSLDLIIALLKSSVFYSDENILATAVTVCNIARIPGAREVLIKDEIIASILPSLCTTSDETKEIMLTTVAQVLLSDTGAALVLLQTDTLICALINLLCVSCNSSIMYNISLCLAILSREEIFLLKASLFTELCPCLLLLFHSVDPLTRINALFVLNRLSFSFINKKTLKKAVAPLLSGLYSDTASNINSAIITIINICDSDQETLYQLLTLSAIDILQKLLDQNSVELSLVSRVEDFQKCIWNSGIQEARWIRRRQVLWLNSKFCANNQHLIKRISNDVISVIITYV